MGDKTGIGWTDATWNPVTGCSKVSPGCAHCYAEELTSRYAGRNAGFIEEHRPWTPANAEHNVRLWPERLDQPLRWQKPRMVFVNSMSDLFHEQVPDEYIGRVFAVMAAAQQHTFQVLTKRPERMRRLVGTLGSRDGIGHPEIREFMQGFGTQRFSTGWPLPNVWLGTSIENRRYVGRADDLRATPAAVRFISAEPLLGPLLPDADHLVDADGDTYEVGNADFRAWRPWADDYDGPGLNLTGIDWLIVGGESGPRHRPIEQEWVRDLRDVCSEDGWDHDGRDGHTAFFFKQWGGRTPKAGGRELDGRTWDEMPARHPEEVAA